MNAELFGKNYLAIRNENIIPLVSYGIKKTKLPHWLFKEIIATKPLSITKLAGRSNFEVELEQSVFYNALHGEIELFLNRAMIQYYESLNSSKESRTWPFVTIYYFTFFCCTCFSRFMRSGFIFLDSSHKSRFERLYLAYYSTPILMDSGGYYFSFKELNSSGNVVISLRFKGDNFHKLNWEELHRMVQTFLPNCDTDEFRVFSKVDDIFKFYKTEFPSNVRNKLNYNGESSIYDLDQSLPIIDLEILRGTTFINDLVRLPLKDSPAKRMECTGYIGILVLEYILKFYSEYRTRSKFGADFELIRKTFLKKNKITTLRF